MATPVNHALESIHVDTHLGVDVLFTSLVLIVLALVAGAKFRSGTQIEPTGKLDLASVTETIVGGVYHFTEGLIGHKAKSLFALTGSLAFFILINNLLGLVPGFNPPTDQFNVTIVLGLIVFVITHVLGFQTHGFAYIKHFMGPAWWLAWLMFPIELISHLVRPLSLALRLFGNITGDHMVGAVFFGILPLVLPLPFLGLGLFVSFVQTFVFLLLTLVYFQMALAHDH
ncbi:MAG: ATP synthase F0 subunit A [Candidatus Lambdaproteobacteria bacterium RIFOXYD12_FULL_49_8]|uniref:ATP synthase subunit a n=1 Tax=Candidatus Lambdaproteobacteria bacterium RIFOXYD2_FULL_50_16 TaxID=1817772 RepID=A0A1F6GBF5_9PROT|nr:MAG: ATP synthase F0 subunit A [Candidatus Lambdaproteobacteria bacterium RIFOXYD2_FULL_50_16]OGG97725.1 MAG: ATP synthase F0 subunit A [Candidatus Lambdaproteobacteria bacterium RIFOXYD12_FULL_49_8]